MGRNVCIGTGLGGDSSAGSQSSQPNGAPLSSFEPIDLEGRLQIDNGVARLRTGLLEVSAIFVPLRRS